MSDLQGLSGSDLQVVRDILDQFVPAREVRVFGSRAGDDSKPWSDLDLLVLGDPLPVSVLAALREAFTESDLSFRVDVVEAQSLSQELRERWLSTSHRVQPSNDSPPSSN